jgi:hypothetical protein
MRLTANQLANLLGQFGRQITRQPLALVTHAPEAWAHPVMCFNNVDRKVDETGGGRQCGWMFNERLVASIENGNYLIAVNHAVWAAPDGKLIDITPFHAETRHHPLGPVSGRIWFLADDEAVPTVAALPSKFYPLSSESALADHLRKLAEKEEELFRATLARPIIASRETL